MLSRKKLHSDKGASLLIAMFYVETYTELSKRFEPNIVAQKLKDLGRNVAKSYYEIWQPSQSSVSGIAKEVAEKVGGIRKLTLKKTEDGFTLTSPDCPLCLSEVEIEGPHYCISTMAILETFLNLFFEDRPNKFRYKAAIGEVIHSKSSGAEDCEYHYRLIEKEGTS